MTNVKRFKKFLEEHDYTDSWDAKLTFKENDFVKYHDQGGWFKLEEDLTFTTDEEDIDEINFDTYEEFIKWFKSMYSCC